MFMSRLSQSFLNKCIGILENPFESLFFSLFLQEKRGIEKEWETQNLFKKPGLRNYKNLGTFFKKHYLKITDHILCLFQDEEEFIPYRGSEKLDYSYRLREQYPKYQEKKDDLSLFHVTPWANFFTLGGGWWKNPLPSNFIIFKDRNNVFFWIWNQSYFWLNLGYFRS